MIAIRGERAIIDDLFEQIHNGKLSASAITWFSDYSFWERAFSTGPDIRENQANLLRFHTRQVEAGRLAETKQMGAMQTGNLEWAARAMKWDLLERERRLTETIAAQDEPAACRRGWVCATLWFAQRSPLWLRSGFASMRGDGRHRSRSWFRSTFPPYPATRSYAVRSS